MEPKENILSYEYNFEEGNDVFNGYILPKAFKKIQRKIEDLEVREGDVWVCTHPKSGEENPVPILECLNNYIGFKFAPRSSAL